ncbi:hypothetical protein ACVWXN_007894 [Bradyrhizobium sp. i1.4.4]
MTQQHFMILPDRLRQYAFHKVPDGNRQSEALRVEGACRAGYIHHSQELAIGGMVNWNSGAGPTLNSGAKMLSSANLDRLRFSHCGANGVGADIGLAPASSMFKVNSSTGINDPGVALRIDDQPCRICQDHHGVGVAQERSRVLQRRPGGMTKRSMPRSMAKQFGFWHEGRHCAVNSYVVALGSLPRRGDRRSKVGGQSPALDKCFPRDQHFPLVHCGSSEMTMRQIARRASSYRSS